MELALLIVVLLLQAVIWRNIRALRREVARVHQAEPMTEIGQRLTGLESLLTQDAHRRVTLAEQMVKLGPGGRDRLRARLADLAMKRAARQEKA